MHPEETYALFNTLEPASTIASRLGLDRRILRKWWTAQFGAEAVAERSKRVHSLTGTATGRAGAGRPRTLKEVSEACSRCGAPIAVNLIQKARSKRLLCTGCDEQERGVDCHCPVCGFGCVGHKGLAGHMARPQTGDMEAHATYLANKEEAPWVDKVMGLDYVTCNICGQRGERIDRHLMAEHSLTTDAYRRQYPNALVQATALVERRTEGVRQYQRENSHKGVTKTIICPSCDEDHTVSLSFSSADHRCPVCRESARWEGKKEGQDYVVCAVCGHRAENLVSHIRSVHPELETHYKETFPGMGVVALYSGVRDKTTLKGRNLPEETRALMAQNAGRWNKGRTKETDPRLAQASRNMQGRVPWSKGLTRDTEPRLQTLAHTVSKTRAARHWTNGNEVTLTPEQLLPFTLKNGKISVGRAIAALGHAFVTIRRECLKHGLQISHTAVHQAICLETIAQALSGAYYETEWSSDQFLNPNTGRRFRFDGYFPGQKLIVEFHGSQHYGWPNHLSMDLEAFCDQQERDRIKENMVHADPSLRYFLVREDEPYADVGYLRGRLLDEGVLDPTK